MAYLPNIYKMTHVETGEIFEGTAIELANMLHVGPTTIQKAYTDGRVMTSGYRVDLLGKKESVNKKGMGNSVLKEWDDFMEAVRRGRKGRA